MTALDPHVVWHDLECGGYRADLSLWRELAVAARGPVLDVGAGTGRVALDLAARGHTVVALDVDARLLGALAQRAHGLDVRTVVADARAFALELRFALCLVPMQTIQLLGGAAGRAAFLRRARAHLQPGATLAAALTSELEPFEPELPGIVLPVPDAGEVGGTLFSSQPIAIRDAGERVALERIRTTREASGRRTATGDVIHLDRLSADTLEAEAAVAGFAIRSRRSIAATDEHVGSEVVLLGG